MKTCTKCGVEKESDAFYKEKSRRDGLRPWCKACHKTYYLQNRDSYLRTSSAHYRATIDKHKEYNKQYHKDHQEHYSEYWKKYYNEQREQSAERMKRWQADNPEKLRIIGHKRRALKRQVIATLTTDQWENTKEHFDNRCAYCGNKLPLEQDHFIALSKLGEYSHNNIIPACRSCNHSKHNASFFDWYPKQEFYAMTREGKILSFLNYKKGRQQLSFMV